VRRSVLLVAGLAALAVVALLIVPVGTIAQPTASTPGGLQIGSIPTRASLQIGPTPTPTRTTGVSGNSYLSPSYGFTLTWAPLWSVVKVSSVAGVDTLSLTDKTSTVTFTTSTEYSSDVTRCRTALVAALAADPKNANVAPAPDTAGKPLQGGDASSAWAVYLYSATTSTGKQAMATYLECRTIEPGTAVVQIVDAVAADKFNGEASNLLTLLDNLLVPGAPAPVATTPSATAVASPAATAAPATPAPATPIPTVAPTTAPTAPASPPATPPPASPAATIAVPASPAVVATPAPATPPPATPVPATPAVATPVPTPPPTPTLPPSPTAPPSPTPTPNLGALGVKGNTYKSPNYGFTVAWDTTWTVEDAKATKGGSAGSGFDQLVLSNGTSRMTFTGSQDFGGNSLECVQGVSAQMKSQAGVSNFQQAKAPDGSALAGGNAADAFGVFAYQLPAANGQPQTLAAYIECQTLVPGQAVLVSVQTVPATSYNDQIAARRKLLNAVHVPAALPAASGAPRAATPAGQIGPLVADRPVGGLAADQPALHIALDQSASSPPR